MPDVVGLPLRKARLLVQNAGLVVDAITFQESYETRDTVLAQKPMRGQMVYAGDKVTLTVSRESYVKWLPSIYQRADINGRNFFRDFLWIVQHLFGSIEETLDVIHQYFDPYEAPEKFLPWLASWSAMVLEEDWPLDEEAAPHPQGDRALSHPRHGQGAQAVHLALHRARAGHQREPVAVPRLAHRRHVGDRHRLGGAAAGEPGAHLHRRDAGQLQGRLAGVGDPHPRDHPDGEAGEHAVLPALRLRGRRQRSVGVHGHRRRRRRRHRPRRRRTTRPSRPRKT